MNTNKFNEIASILRASGFSMNLLTYAEIILRVKLTASSANNLSGDELFEEMQKSSASELGYFRCSPKTFESLYNYLKDEDIIDYLVAASKNNDEKSGQINTPRAISDWIYQKLSEKQWNSTLFPISDNLSYDFREIAEKYDDKAITIGTVYPVIRHLLEIAYCNYKNVSVIRLNVYEKLSVEEKYDFIFCIPAFGGRKVAEDDSFICRDLDMVATENLLSILSTQGKLYIVLPGRIAFSSGRIEKLRHYIEEQFCVREIRGLPCGIFKNMGVKAFFFEFSTEKKEDVIISSYDIIGSRKAENIKVECSASKTINISVLREQGNWSIEHLLDNKSDILRAFYNSPTPKVKLKEVADVFRGKSVKTQEKDGNIAVVNISNISADGIDYANLDTIEEEERKVKRYELQTGDVLLTCRGTAIKAAVFEEQEKTCIPSVSLVVIRPNKKINSEYIKVFFETPVGKEVLKSCSVGGFSIQMTNTDVMEITIPLLDVKQQLEIVELYSREKAKHKQLIAEAEKQWHAALNDITNRMK